MRKLYSDVEDGIANGIAVEYGNKVYITDSSKENSNVRFGVRKDPIYIMSDATHRANFVRRTNYDSCGKGNVSDGLFAKLGYGNVNRGKSGGRRPLGKKLSANNGTPQYNQKRISKNNADQGVSRERAKQRTNDGINELLEQLKTQLDPEAESHIADEYDQADKKMLGQLKTLLDKGTQGKASRELDVIDYIDEQAEQEGRGRAEVKPMSNREKAVYNISIKLNAVASKCKQCVNIAKTYLQIIKTMV